MAAKLVRGDTVDRRPVQLDVPGVRLVETGEQIEERRLARAVRADQGRDRATLDLELVDVNSNEAPELASNPLDPQDGSGLATPG